MNETAIPQTTSTKSRRKKRRKISAWSKLVLLTLSVCFTFLVCEWGVRIASEHVFFLFDVEMWRYARLIKRESLTPGIVEEHRPNRQARLMGVNVRTDGHGFRRADPQTEQDQRPDHRLIVALGDSVTLGWGVPEGMTYADQLQRKLNTLVNDARGTPVRVLNAGVGNTNTAMQLQRYKRDIRPLQPDWLILGFFINDSESNPKPSQNPLIRHSALATLINSRTQVHLSANYGDYHSYYAQLYAKGAPGWIMFREAVRDFGGLLQQDGTSATLLLLPEMHEPKNHGPFQDVYQKVATVARQSGFEVIDASKNFPEGAGQRYWVTSDDAHPNAEAHTLFAEALTRSRFAATGETQ